MDDELLKPPDLSKFEVKNPYEDLVKDSAIRHGVDPKLIKVMMLQESGFKPAATSYKGASGLMQLMPDTAKRFGVTDIYDPKQNIEAGVKYTKWLLDRYEGNVDLALAGYNAGEGSVDKYGKTIPPFKETQNYVKTAKERYTGSGYYTPDLSTFAVNKQTTNPNLSNDTSVPDLSQFDLNKAQKPIRDVNPTFNADGTITANIDGKVQQLQPVNLPVKEDNVVREKKLRSFVLENNFEVVRTFGKNLQKSRGGSSLHPFGLAIDVRTKGKSQAEIEALMLKAVQSGRRVWDERLKFADSNSTGEHLHFEENDKPSRLQDDSFYSPGFADKFRAAEAARFGQTQNPNVRENQTVQNPQGKITSPYFTVPDVTATVQPQPTNPQEVRTRVPTVDPALSQPTPNQPQKAQYNSDEYLMDQAYIL